MTKRDEQKEESRQRILESTARLLREDGLSGTSVNSVMKDAGLTHGGFYAHFKNKGELAAKGYETAMNISREKWFDGLEDKEASAALDLLINRYLCRDHRDNPGTGCPMPPLLGELSKEDLAASEVQSALKTSAHRAEKIIQKADGMDDMSSSEKSIAMLSAMVGGMLLARSVEDPEFSEEILKSTRHFLKQTLID